MLFFVIIRLAREKLLVTVALDHPVVIIVIKVIVALMLLVVIKDRWGDLLRSVPLSCWDILNLTFFRLDFHQLLIKIS